MNTLLTTIAIVGRPNVGKSTLFNRLTKTRNAIVGDTPGLTRDRQYGIASIEQHEAIVIDTGGIGENEDPIANLMAKQTEQALQEASLILFLVDGKSGLIPVDATIAKTLRKLNKSIILVANKIDNDIDESKLNDFYQLGLGEPLPIAAAHNQGIGTLLTAINQRLPEATTETSSEQNLDAIKIAFIGRPNVGKSTLVNRILGEERVVVYDLPGTTRDSIYINFQRRNKNYVLIDTAGIRRRGKIDLAIEKFSVIKALQAISATHVVVFVIDATENITEQDLKLLGFVLEAGKALVIAVNKWDNLSQEQRIKIKSEIDRRLTFIDFAEIYFISALHGTKVGNLFTGIEKAYRSATRELKTPEVTKILERAVTNFQPPLVRGREIRLLYAHVGGHNPPTIIIHGKRMDSLPSNYHRYLEHYFRDALKLKGTPIRIVFKT